MTFFRSGHSQYSVAYSLVLNLRPSYTLRPWTC